MASIVLLVLSLSLVATHGFVAMPLRARGYTSRYNPRAGRLFSEQAIEVVSGQATYIQCGKCKAVYPMTLEVLGRGKKVTCSVCEHSWWQNSQRLTELREGFQLEDLSQARVAEIKEALALGKDPSEEKPRRKGAVTIFVGNLPFHYEDKEVEETFAPFGEVASITLVRQPDGTSKGYAFVDMVDKPAGEKAIAELDGFVLQGRNLHVALGGNSKGPTSQ
jgi:predicted Zn finger-like uncharacterized protein